MGTTRPGVATPSQLPLARNRCVVEAVSAHGPPQGQRRLGRPSRARRGPWRDLSAERPQRPRCVSAAMMRSRRPVGADGQAGVGAGDILWRVGWAPGWALDGTVRKASLWYR